jgi:hypothetical protein
MDLVLSTVHRVVAGTAPWPSVARTRPPGLARMADDPFRLRRDVVARHRNGDTPSPRVGRVVRARTIAFADGGAPSSWRRAARSPLWLLSTVGFSR